ncbi:hypothetical protein D3C78_1244390 [compost metagenome]
MRHVHSLHPLATGEIPAQGATVQLSTFCRAGVTLCCRQGDSPAGERWRAGADHSRDLLRPKISPYVGSVRPSALAVIRVIAKQNHETIQVHGAEAARAFHLSTQMQTQPVLYTSGSSREIRIGALTIRLRHVSPEKLQHAGTKVGLALVALFYLGRKGVNPTSVAKIKCELTQAEFKQLVACKIPAWMSKALAGPPPA